MDSKMNINALLPDELLLLILGFVEDGETLLDAVPLVCKRWHRVSKDPRAWASARVDVYVASLGMSDDESDDANEEEDDGEDGQGDEDGTNDEDDYGVDGDNNLGMGGEGVPGVDSDDDEDSSDTDHSDVSSEDDDTDDEEVSGTDDEVETLDEEVSDDEYENLDEDISAHGELSEDSDDSENSSKDRGGHVEGSFWGPDRHRSLMTVCRIFTRAPFLHNVTIQWSYAQDKKRVFACDKRARFVLAALRRSKAAVQRLSLDEDDPFDESCLGDPGNGRINLLADLLANFKDSLQYLRVGHLQLLASQKVQDALSKMKQLKSLFLMLNPESDAPKPLREALLPNLECLQTDRVSRRDPFPATLIASLVRGAASRLRHLHFHRCSNAMPEAVMAEVRRCEGLRALTCDLADAAVLPELPELRKLSLRLDRDFFDDYDGVDNDYASLFPAHLTAVAQALATASGAPLASLRLLHVKVKLLGMICVETVDAKKIRSALRDLFSALASAASNVTTLKLNLQDGVDHEPFLESMPHLRSLAVCIGSCNTLALLTKLAELETLTLLVPIRLSKQNERAAMDLLPRATPDFMPRLRTLRVTVARQWPGDLDPAVEVLLEATATAASGATTLRLDSEPLELDNPIIGLFLERMPRLRVVTLYRCSVKTLGLLSRLPELEKLAVSVWRPEASDEVAKGLTVRDVLTGMRCLRSVHLGEVSSVGVLEALSVHPQIEVLCAKVRVEDMGARRPFIVKVESGKGMLRVSY